MHLNTTGGIKQERPDVNELHQCLIHAGDVKPIRQEHQYHTKKHKNTLAS